MKLTDKNLDKVFQDAAVHSKALDYKEAYWEEFESILNTEQKKKGGLWIWFSAGTLAFALLSTFLFLDTNKNQITAIQSNTSDTKNNVPNFNYAEELNELQNSKHLNKLYNSSNRSVNKTKNYSATSNLSNTSNDGISENAITNELENLNVKKSNLITLSKIPQDLSETTSEKVDQLTLRIIDAKAFNAERETIVHKALNPNKRKGWSFYTQLNVGISEAYNENILDRSLASGVSLNVEHNFENLVIRTGLGFSATTNTAIAFSDRSKVYGYSSNSYSHHIIYDNLYELYVPLEIGVEVKGYTFGAGLQVNYLLGNTLHFSSVENNEVVIEEDYKNIKEGLNDFSLSGHVFVDKAISKHISLGAKAGTLLTDRYSKENIFEFGENRKNPLFGQLYLKLNF